MKTTSTMLVLLLPVLAFFSIAFSKPVETEVAAEYLAMADHSNPQEMLLTKALEAHGWAAKEAVHYQFTFRKKRYTFFEDDKGNYRYTVTRKAEDQSIVETLTNQGFQRAVEGQAIDLSSEDVSRYSEALNSVIYFATLPHKLNDPAVIRAYGGTATVAGTTYELLEVSFKQAGGGKDYQDQFLYWVHRERGTIDYMAYNYQVNGGGVRFRKAFNPRTVAGIRFQDYENYKAPVSTDLAQLPQLWEAGKLELLSTIETADVESITQP